MMALVLIGSFAAPVGAQAITVTNSSTQSRFPEGVVFRLAATSDSPITEVRLRYRILPEGVLSTAQPEFRAGPSVNATHNIEGNAPPRSYLPPGTPIEYFWELTDEAGVINLHWYSGSESFAQEMLATARRTIDGLSALLQAPVDFSVHVWVYANRDDMQPALIRRSESFESQVITAGERVSENTVLVLGSSGALDTLSHELAHIVTAVAGEGPFGRLPAWLDEGTAVYAQTSPGGFRSALERAADRGQVLSLRSISSAPGSPGTVDLFYGQSWSTVCYLIDTYGGQEFAQLFATFNKGATTDEALLAVYGFDQDGLEEEWRASLGLPPRERPQDEPSQDTSPTLPPSSEPTAPRPAEDDNTPIGLIAGLVAGLLALGVTLGLGGYLIARRLR
jgi:hypothetical protein